MAGEIRSEVERERDGSVDERSGGGTDSDPEASPHSAPAFGFSPGAICHLYQMEQKEDKPTTTRLQADSVESQLAGTKTLGEAAGVVTASLVNRLARALAVPVEDIDVNMPPFTFGVDSLVAVELMFWFSNEIRADVPVVQILGNSSVAKLGLYAADLSGYVGEKLRSRYSGVVRDEEENYGA